MSSFTDLFNQLEGTQSQETINSSWTQLQSLYTNKSAIQPLIQVYDESSNQNHRFLSLHGIRLCLSNSFIHFNQTEMYQISTKIVDMYLNEKEDFLKLVLADIICYLLENIGQTWDNLDHLIYQSKPSHPSYMKILFHYLMKYPNKDLMILKFQQTFDYNLILQLEGFEILLFFIEDPRKIYKLFSKKICKMVQLVFTSNDVKCFQIFCQILDKFFPKVFPYCEIYLFTSNLDNKELNPSILIMIRDFINNNLMKMLEYQYQYDEKKIEDKDSFFNEALIDIFTKEVSLSNFLYSIEIDEMTTTSDTFAQLVSLVPQELVETTIHELADSNEKPPTCTSIQLFSAFIQNSEGSEEFYNFFTTKFLNTGENIINEIAIESLYELKDYLKPYFQPPLIEFLMNWTLELKNDESNNQSLIHIALLYLAKFIQEFDDISPLLNGIFDFSAKILNDGKELEIQDILIIFNYSITCCNKKSDEISSLYRQLAEIILQLIDQTSSDEILYLSYSLLMVLLLTDKSIIEPFIDTILTNLSTVYSLKFISICLAFFKEKVENVIQQNFQKIIELCNSDIDDPFKALTAFETEVTIFNYYKSKIDLSSSILNLFFTVIKYAMVEMKETIKIASTTFFKCLNDNDVNFDPNTITPVLFELLNDNQESEKLIIEIVGIIINIYKDSNKLDVSPFIEYVVSETEKIFKSENADSFEPILIVYMNLLENAINIADKDSLENVIKLSFAFLSDKKQIVVLYCLHVFLECEKKINFEDEKLIVNIIDMINLKNNEEEEDNLSDEIACTAAKFINLMVSKDQETTSKCYQLILETSLKNLIDCEDQEISENLISILIKLESFYKEEGEIYQTILKHFPVRIEKSAFECCYNWIITKLDNFSEELKETAFQSIVYFITCDIRQFFTDEIISAQLLEALFNIASNLPKQLILDSLNGNPNLLSVFDSHMQYIQSIMKKSDK